MCSSILLFRSCSFFFVCGNHLAIAVSSAGNKGRKEACDGRRTENGCWTELLGPRKRFFFLNDSREAGLKDQLRACVMFPHIEGPPAHLNIRNEYTYFFCCLKFIFGLTAKHKV